MNSTIKISRYEIGKAEYTKLLFAFVFIGMVFVPLFSMLGQMDAESIKAVVSSPRFGEAVVNSLVSALVGTLITVAIAFVLALCIRRTNIRLKGLFEVIFVLPMLLPSISHGMGLVILFGNNGILTKFLNLNSSIYGLSGIVIGSVLYAFPVAYLMLSDVFQYEDGSAYEAADVLGISKFRQFTAIMLPFLRKPLISVVFATFTMMITDYGVPLMVGGKYNTIATVMYQEVIGQMNYKTGAVYGTFLLIPAVIAFVIDALNKDRGNSGYVTKPCKVSKSKLISLGSYLYCIAVSVATILPIFAFVVRAFAKNYPTDLSFTLENVTKTFRLRADEYFVNSLIIAAITSVLGVIIAFMTAYLSARMKSKLSRFLHLSAMTSAAIPGLVLGLSYVIVFNSFRAIYGTIFLLAFVNIIHFIASPYLMMYNSMCKINENIEDVAHTMGIKRSLVIKDVLIPQCRNTILEMFSFFFVNCMMTISAVSFLAKTTNKPLSLMIDQFNDNGKIESAAVVSLLILITNLIVKAVVRLLRKNKV